MTAKTQDEVVYIICHMTEDRQDSVVSLALDMWEMDGCPVCGAGDTGDTGECHDTGHTGHSVTVSSIESRLSLEINVD